MKKLLAILLSACMLLTLRSIKSPAKAPRRSVSFSAAARMTMASISVSTNWPRESSLNSASKSF